MTTHPAFVRPRQTSVTIWRVALAIHLPRVNLALLRVVAGLLDNPRASADLLFLIAEWLRQAAIEAALDGLVRDAGDLDELARIVAVEAERPRPGFW